MSAPVTRPAVPGAGAGPTRRVLILGGTGVFGSRLAGHLVRHPEDLGPVEIVVSSRDRARAERLALVLRAQGGPAVRGIAADARRGWSDVLAAERPWAVVDCSGPFQGAGHAVAEAALRAGAHALDLADARDYLAGYPSLDGLARSLGVAGLAGASSTPALSGAVARRLTRGWSRVHSVEVAIVPGGRSEVGRAVLEAVLSYAGRPVPVWRDGGPASTPGWVGGRRLDVPGLGHRRVVPVETSDAERLGPLLDADHVTFWAGLESTPEQLGLEAMAHLRRRGLLPDLRALSGPLRHARRLTRLTTGDAGGMVVAAEGTDAAGQPRAARWVLLARCGHGPQVPTLPAAAALRALARGHVAPGARLADEALDLAAIKAEMRPHGITTDLRARRGRGSEPPHGDVRRGVRASGPPARSPAPTRRGRIRASAAAARARRSA